MEDLSSQSTYTDNRKSLRVGLVFDVRDYNPRLPPESILIDLKSLQPVGHNLYIIETKPFDDSFLSTGAGPLLTQEQKQKIIEVITNI